IIPVVEPEDKDLAAKVDKGEYCFVGDGIAINSGKFTGLSTAEFKEKITKWLQDNDLGKKAVNYKLRDWLFSRQRYWGEPFPLLHCEDGSLIALDEKDLPLVLPEVKTYKPAGTGESPLATIDNWLNVKLPDGRKAKRETNTMPQWAGSCWYYLRYLDPNNDHASWEKDKEKYWMPVDLYIGGAEHAVLHLLYSRFWHKTLYDLGYVSTVEPFKKLINQGMILGEDNQKMSKSRGNVVNPDKVITDYGADSMRLYEMFMGPLEATKPWNMQGVEGVHRFLNKLWRTAIDEQTGNLNSSIKDIEADEETQRLLHQTIKKVTQDIDNFRFNTAISQMMIFVNHLSKLKTKPKKVIELFVLVLAPFSPHIAEELWQKLGHTNTLACEKWPKFDENLAKEKEIEIAVQVLGKIKDKIVVSADADEEEIKQKALACEKVAAAIAGKEIKKIIVIKSRLVNIVTG
ncbi:MAG: class I tRNA ligase family protein, partial [Planctomycetes bacterium]|nr:class I tRNA ligase family protein [Planctomycetota bacterium]